MLFNKKICILAKKNNMDYKKATLQELLKEEEKISKRYEEIEEECLKDRLGFNEFQERAKKEKEALYFIDKYKRLRQDPIVEYGKEWKGDLYTIDEFKSAVKHRLFVDSDGIGYYATETSKSDVEVLPSDFEENIIREDFSHIMWFNR